MKTSVLVFAFMCTLAWGAGKKQDTANVAVPLPPLDKTQIEIDGHPESVATDDQGNIYFTCVGAKLEPSAKDGDGYIGMIPYGSTVVKKLPLGEEVHAPKGLLIADGFLYFTDVDKVHKYNLKDGYIVSTVDLSPSRMTFLNDLAWINGRLMVSATDTDQIFYVDTTTCSYGELVPKQAIYKPNGLAWDPERKLIYLCEYATDAKTKKPSGRILSINPVSREVKEIAKDHGMFDGLVYHDNALYYSDWSQDGKPQAIRRLDLKTGRSVPVASAAVKGAADFTVYGDMLIVPGMTEKIIHIMPMQVRK